MKTMNDSTTIAEIVADDFRTASVFAEYGIDFCCKGHRTISEVCSKQQLDQDTLLKDLAAAAIAQPAGENYNDWPLSFLMNYIETTHHAYIRKQVPVIRAFLDKLYSVHGARHPELVDVKELFEQGSDHLLSHMMKEEKILFPLIRRNCEAIEEPGTLSMETMPVGMPVRVMEEEHEAEGNRFSRIAEITDNYSVPADGCASYQAAWAMLKDFERDLHKHIHLENNILFPKALMMDNQRN